jgi:biotin transport system substrate-specific component
MATTPRLLRIPPFERGLTLGDFLVPIRIDDRVSSRVHNAALVLLGILVIAASAQVAIPVPGTGVPITGQTFGILATATALGLRRGVASVGLYVILGFALPIYAGGESGIERLGSIEEGRLVFGATGGYLLGFVLAGAVVGGLAELGWDRRFAGALAAMLLGSLAVYLVGLPWLALALSLTPGEAVAQGLVPFLLGDAVKFALAAAVFPLGWRLVGRRPSDR